MIFWSEDKEVKQCKHCGVNFTVDESIGWKQSREQFTCDDCYQSGNILSKPPQLKTVLSLLTAHTDSAMGTLGWLFVFQRTGSILRKSF